MVCVVLLQSVVEVTGKQAAPVVPEPGSIVVTRVSYSAAGYSHSAQGTVGSSCSSSHAM